MSRVESTIYDGGLTGACLELMCMPRVDEAETTVGEVTTNILQGRCGSMLVDSSCVAFKTLTIKPIPGYPHQGTCSWAYTRDGSVNHVS